MARKDDVKMLFDFMIEMLKEDNGKIEENKPKVLIAEENQPKTQKFEIFDTSRIKTIMDKMEAKEHEKAMVKQALNVQAKDYKKEIEELKEAFNQKVLKEDKLDEENNISTQTPSMTGGTV
jgi:phenylalanyl-tRNA synthetase alpha subunit